MKKLPYILGLLVLVSSQQMTNAQIPPSHSSSREFKKIETIYQIPAAATGQVPGMLNTPLKMPESKQAENNLMAAQTAAIQSLSKRIDELTARVTRMEAVKKQGGQP